MVKENIFNKLTKLQFCLLHPNGTDAKEILNQVHRIGCSCDHIWPLNSKIELSYDVVIIGLEIEQYAVLKSLLKRRDGFDPTIIAVVDYESPKTLEMLMEFNACAVLAKPVHHFGILATLVLARWNWQRINKITLRANRLEKRLSNQVVVSKAVAIVMKKRQISEQAAYKLIRNQSMSKRLPLFELCESLIAANDIL